MTQYLDRQLRVVLRSKPQNIQVGDWIGAFEMESVYPTYIFQIQQDWIPISLTDKALMRPLDAIQLFKLGKQSNRLIPIARDLARVCLAMRF